MFQPVESSVNFPKLEEAILRFWSEAKIYEKSLERRKESRRFVFYEGPPTANGMPHPGHCLTRAIKDLFPRYRTMRGYLCERKAGWDTHGLPVEVEVCKEMGIHSKEDIEKFGIEPFIQKCQQSVWRYMQEWRRMTERIGFWVNLDEAYVTYHQSYVESVWWSLKQLFDRGLLYQGYKIVWWWAQGGTALSAGEVGQGYREVADPSVYVKFPLVIDERSFDLKPLAEYDIPLSLLVWTTTPWTLPSNHFVAVNPDIEYSFVLDDHEDKKELLIIAKALVETIEKKLKRKLEIVGEPILGKQLVGRRYLSPFPDCYYNSPVNYDDLIWADRMPAEAFQSVGAIWGDYQIALREPPMSEDDEEWSSSKTEKEFVGWQILKGDFVGLDAGTGLVHIAPAFGEDDFSLWQLQKQSLLGLPFICLVDPTGKFTDEGPEYCRGRWVKECDKDIIHDLKNRGLLFHREEYHHEYPFCWRAEEDPLIQYPRKAWFIGTKQYRSLMLANNDRINWLPEHIKHGRFGNFLWTNVDWALSRERFWGTPLPIWECSVDGNHREAVSSFDELENKEGSNARDVWGEAKTKNPELIEDLKVHKPYVDWITYKCNHVGCGGVMRRIPEVIDCWYDSGAMPFAQWGYQGEGGRQKAEGGAEVAKKFHQQFPADFISEALDQTRGWFYSQLAISTLVFGREPGIPSEVSESASKSGKLSEQYLDYFRLKLDCEKSPSDAARHALVLSNPQKSPPISPEPDFPYPFKNCIVLGLMLGEDGQKMSKSKRNYREPGEIFDKYGADALRWYFFATQPPWTTIRYSERAIRDSIPEFLLRLWNVYSFFVIYANIDGFDPLGELSQRVEKSKSQKDNSTLGKLDSSTLSVAKSYRPIKKRSELDRWILSELNRTAEAVVERMDAYDNYTAAQKIIEFVDALSNWYVRRSRDRFWAEDKQDQDKIDAYWTLYECLLTSCKIVAPFVPFLAETMWRNLSGHGQKVEGVEKLKSGEDSSTIGQLDSSTLPLESVHLCDFPTGDAAAIDEALSAQMNLVREIASLGLSARMGAKLKVRQPLAKVEVILVNPAQQAWLESHTEVICKELNVKRVEFTQNADQYISYTVLPDLKKLGPRLGKKLPLVKNALAKADAGKLLAEMEAAGNVALKLDDGSSESLDREDLQVRLQAKPGWAAAQGKHCVVVLATEITPELVTEGVAREIVHAIQSARKDQNCEYTDRIDVGIVTDSAEIRRAAEQFGDYVRGETLATALKLEAIAGVQPAEVGIGDEKLQLYVRPVKK